MAKSPQPLETFTTTDFSTEFLGRKEFEYCEFINCVFPDLSNYIFRDCIFKGCNFSNMKTYQSVIQNCTFKDSKLLGLSFAAARDFSFEVHFENCILDYASFDKKNLNQSSFKNCKMHGVNLTQSNLSKCSFSNCDFFEALFSGTNLSGVDLRNSFNFLIDPDENKIKKAKFSLQGLPGLLYRHEIIVEN